MAENTRTELKEVVFEQDVVFKRKSENKTVKK